MIPLVYDVTSASEASVYSKVWLSSPAVLIANTCTSAAPSLIDNEIPAKQTIQQSSSLFIAKDEDLHLDKRRCFSATDNASDYLHLITSHLYSRRAGSCGFIVSSGNMHECHWLK